MKKELLLATLTMVTFGDCLRANEDNSQDSNSEVTEVTEESVRHSAAKVVVAESESPTEDNEACVSKKKKAMEAGSAQDDKVSTKNKKDKKKKKDKK